MLFFLSFCRLSRSRCPFFLFAQSRGHHTHTHTPHFDTVAINLLERFCSTAQNLRCGSLWAKCSRTTHFTKRYFSFNNRAIFVQPPDFSGKIVVIWSKHTERFLYRLMLTRPHWPRHANHLRHSAAPFPLSQIILPRYMHASNVFRCFGKLTRFFRLIFHITT